MIKELRRPDVREFILKHESEDPVALVLKYSKEESLPIQLISAQIAARQKAKIKLPLFYQHDKVIFPHGVSLEQCSSEATAKYKSTIFQGTSLTDLTGGFGIDSYFLSEGFKESNHVEQNTDLSELVNHNFEVLDSKILCHNTTAEDFLASAVKKSDCYFIDPARRSESNDKVFRIVDCQPDLSQILPIILAQKARVLIKLSPFLDVKQALTELSHVSEVHVVSVSNECKELLFLIEAKFEGSPSIKTVNIKKDMTEHFEFTLDTQHSQPTFSPPQTYIYEPNASIMKAGGFNAITKKFDVIKLHPNTHLYTSESRVNEFPGRTFRLLNIESLSKKKIAPYLQKNKANITVRNFPGTVQSIRKKTGIKEGGEKYLFATTLLNGDHKILICEKG